MESATMELAPLGIAEITASNLALMKSQILDIPETPENKEQYSTARDMHIQAKKILPLIETRRKEIKAPHLDKCREIDATAKDAVMMIQPLIELSGSRRGAWEEIAEREKAAAMVAEQARLDEIKEKLEAISNTVLQAQEYGKTSAEISYILDALLEIKVDDSYQEFADQALKSLMDGTELVQSILDRALKFEADQKAQAEIEAKNKAEAERLERMAEDQEKAAAAIRAELEKARAEIQAEKDRMAQVAEAEKFKERVAWCEKIGAEYYIADWNEAHKLNTEFDLAIEKAAAIEAERQEALKPDKGKLIFLVDKLGDIKIPKFQTDDANEVGIMVDAKLRELAALIMDKVDNL